MCASTALMSCCTYPLIATELHCSIPVLPLHCSLRTADRGASVPPRGISGASSGRATTVTVRRCRTSALLPMSAARCNKVHGRAYVSQASIELYHVKRARSPPPVTQLRNATDLRRSGQVQVCPGIPPGLSGALRATPAAAQTALLWHEYVIPSRSALLRSRSVRSSVPWATPTDQYVPGLQRACSDSTRGGGTVKRICAS